MSRRRLLSLVVAALIVLAAALYAASQRNAAHDVQGVALYPTLGADMAAVVAVTVRKGDATRGGAAGTTQGGITPGSLTIHKTGDLWTVAERGDYPADLVKLRRLLTAMSDAKIVEQKTSDPARYATLGVQDVAPPANATGVANATGAAGATGMANGSGMADATGLTDAGGIEVTVGEKDKKFSLIVGKPVGEGNFVRRVGEKPGYSVEPGVPVETEARNWIDSRLLDVPTQRVQDIEVTPADGPRYALHRSAPGTPPDGKPRRDNPQGSPFSLDGVPVGRTALDANALTPAPTAFAALKAEDVAAATEIDFTHPARAVVTLTDGGVMTLTGTVAGDKHWLTVQFPAEAALDARARGRAFEVASYRYDAIFKPLEQLLTPKPPPAAPKPYARPPRPPTTPAAP